VNTNSHSGSHASWKTGSKNLGDIFPMLMVLSLSFLLRILTDSTAKMFLQPTWNSGWMVMVERYFKYNWGYVTRLQIGSRLHTIAL